MGRYRPMGRDAVADVRRANEIARERERIPRGFGVRDVATGEWVTCARMRKVNPGREDQSAVYGTADEALSAVKALGTEAQSYMVCGILS